MGIVIAGERSGAGKTTVTLALLAALGRRYRCVQAFKVGPDYIDPMFHRAVTGRAAHNLDPVLTSEAYVRRCYYARCRDAEVAVVEGVMGLFDGAGGTDWGSTAHIARILELPIVLVVDCASLSRSLAAIVHGYATFDPRLRIAGVVLNRVGSDRHLTMLKAALDPLKIPIVGVLRREDAIALPDRHLGLVPAEELPHLAQTLDQFAELGQRCFHWPLLDAWVQAQPASQPEDAALPGSPQGAVRIGIARDRAFNFYYPDNLDTLECLGVEWVPFSPLSDGALPAVLDGLYLGGGFPELFAESLAENVPLRTYLHRAIQHGLPTYAECGGLMYLCQTLVDFDGNPWPMVGALPAIATMTRRLSLGYRQATARRSTPLLTPGQTLWGHEFHRSTLDSAPPTPLYQYQLYPTAADVPEPRPPQPEGWGHNTLQASYLHLHWGDRPDLAQRFLQTCQHYQRDRTAEGDSASQNQYR
ncbi:MAG: cobyrinate a,c-diamide synthase [Leptolyngbyaceae cyanobacterium T60_A2020_046]|nr:cobyrinate a,c-diamide synthase [Leptolyngbyaceae cyanobacterium T60_A2020_046]